MRFKQGLLELLSIAMGNVYAAGSVVLAIQDADWVRLRIRIRDCG